MHRRIIVHLPDYAVSKRRKNEGFALALALGLTAFLLILILALSTLSRVETGISGSRLDRFTARQNAMLGLKIALGDLQKMAGRDQCATARADVLGDDSANPYWTGVWSEGEENGQPFWLVSGVDSDPANPVTGVRLAKGIAGQPGVFAPTVTVHPENPPDSSSVAVSNRQGHYAYWVSDEGIKSSLAKTDGIFDLDAERYDELDRKRLRQLTPMRFGREEFFPELVNEDRNEIREGLLKTESIGQISHLPGVASEQLRNSFFDATYLSYGVLSNTATGGLKKDLSASTVQDSGFTFLESLKSASGMRINGNGFVEYPGSGFPPTLNSGDYLNSPSPLASEFALFVGIFKNSVDSDQFRLEFGLWSEVWNPYSFPMAFDPETENDLTVRISGLPEIEVRWESARGQSNNQIGSFSLKLEDFQDEFTINFGIPLAEGEVKTRIARVRHVLEQSLPAGTVNNPAKNFVTLSAPASKLTVRFFNASGQLLREVRNLPFDAFTTSEYGLSRDASPSRTNPKHFQFAYHYKMLDNPFLLVEGQKSDMEKWLSETDFRSLILDVESNPLHASLLWLTGDPSALHFEVFFDDTDMLDDGAGKFYRFYDYPSLDPVSIGSLQHLQVLQGRPFSIGNPWGGQRNAVFDRFFFSTVPQNDASWNPSERLLNTHLATHETRYASVTTENLRNQYSSIDFLVEGTFNINSTSIKAWKSVLSGLELYDWTYRFDDFTFTEPLPPITRPRVKNGIFHLPNGADRHFSLPSEMYPDYPEISPQEKKDWYKRPQQDWKNAFRTGMRELTEQEVDDLARAIVRLLREGGEPFSSIEQFVNSGLVQEAIDSTTINSVNGADYESATNANRIPRYAPSFLTQADIFSNIAPFIQTRSDTFLIRAYGDAYNPLTKRIRGRAWCEALVQRVPTPVDFRDTTDEEKIVEDHINPPGPFGRRFQIIHFRWLDSTDI